MDAKLAKIYYSPQGYWKGVSAIKKLADAAKVPENVVKQWLYKQAIWQIFLPAPRYVPRPKFDVATPNSVHQADLLFLPHDKLRRKTYKYALTVVDIASRYKEAEPLTSKESNEVAKAFQAIYKRGPLTWPSMLQVDPGREFMGGVTKEMEKHKTYIRRGRTEIHRDQAIVERFNRTLAERLFGHQYAVEMLHAGRSTEWVKRLPDVVNALNNEVTRLTGKKPAVAIKEKNIVAKPSTPYSRPLGVNEKKTSTSHPCEVFVSAWRTWGWNQKSNRSHLVFESLPGCKKYDKAEWACCLLFVWRAQAWLRSWRAVGCAA